MPEMSGNTINGLGEAEIRRPTHVYWHEPDTLHHGEMQKWFYTQNMDHEGIKKARADREKIHAIVVPPVSDMAKMYSLILFAVSYSVLRSTFWPYRPTGPLPQNPNKWR